ncbi:hypothetical protein [Amnibacterium setariae]|uniref:AbiEi antitoxin C-terminal domain-containing protein n=1 Tax=Amnibacterium setariae TaxID=2306585 RepID=A0A3A1TSY5_9MICO|nr:hypothetical protein [Amnibacterium setariae]RIX26382.1 hypothetical protein D1781_15640 [Amnibacterium setariae]
MNPWQLEIIVVREGSHGGGERRELTRDVGRGLLVRLRQGAYVEREAFAAMTPEDQHLVRMRAFAAVARGPVVFSAFSAAVAHGLPVLRARLASVHTAVGDRRERGQEGVTAHLLPVTAPEVVRIGGILVTSIARTVVDIAGGAPFDEGVMAADAALRLGTVREELEAAHDLVAPRRAARRIREVVAFAHPGGESAAESGSRALMLRLGIAPPRLQHRLVLDDGSEVFLDFLFAQVRVGGEADGDVKYLDPRLAPAGAGRAVVKEKRREDEVRTRVAGLARWGWAESRRPDLLRRVLQRVGVEPSVPRATLADYAALARGARPSFVVRRGAARVTPRGVA